MAEPKERRAPHRANLSLSISIGAALVLLSGPSVGLLLGDVMLGVLLFALVSILLALRGYLETGDKVVAGTLIFVALVVIGIEAVVYLLGP